MGCGTHTPIKNTGIYHNGRGLGFVETRNSGGNLTLTASYALRTRTGGPIIYPLYINNILYTRQTLGVLNTPSVHRPDSKFG